MDHEEIGPVVRRIRRGADMTLQQMSSATGLSQSFLSQFERGRTQASISSLRVITEALGMNIHDVLGVAGSGGYSSVVRGADRPRIPFGERATKTIVSSRGLGRFEVLEVVFNSGGSTGDEQYAHGKHDELLLVLSGCIGVELGEERHLLDAGDSLSYHSETPHRVSNAGGDPARVLWVVSPPGAHSGGSSVGQSAGRPQHPELITSPPNQERHEAQ